MISKIFLAGSGWVTPLGRGVSEVMGKIHQGERPTTGKVTVGSHEWPAYLVDPAITADVSRFPRLRRSGAISHFALAAAKDAVEQAGLTAEQTADMPVFFATSDGGVVYTRKFFQGLEQGGPGSGSPLLFPETVYNAPPSHIAAFFGTRRESSAFVGDATAVLAALAAACPGETPFSHALVVAANECDAISMAAYSRWGFMKKVEGAAAGNIFSEGAAAVVVTTNPKPGSLKLKFHEGRPFTSQQQALEECQSLRDRFPETPGFFSLSSPRTPLESIERTALGITGETKLQDIKLSLGESLACSALWQIVAAESLCRESGTPGCLSILGNAGNCGMARLE